MRYLHLIHRWLGIGLGLFILLWFFSGLVMLFVGYPKLTPAERMARLEPIDLKTVSLDAKQAWAVTGLHGEPDKVRLAMQAQRPVYHLLHDGTWQSVWADNGAPVIVTSKLAQSLAGAFPPHADIAATALVDRDQWSLSSSLNPYRPLYRVSLRDEPGTALYISSRTGEVVLDTRRSERAWNWAGSVIHWIYFTPLRAERELWRQLVLWLAFGGVMLAVLGMWLGIQRTRIRQPYKDKSVTPYHGWKRWHHLTGLAAGIFCLTWLVSGWLSLTPFDWLSERSLSAQELENWSGGKLSVQDMHLPPDTSPTLKDIREIEWLRFGGNFYLLGHVAGRDCLFAENGHAAEPFTTAQLQARAARLQPESAIKSAAWLPLGDLYYRSGRERTISPALRVDFADARQTSYYIDPLTTQILESQDRKSRLYRWLFNGLHQLDLPPLTDHLQARRVSVFVLSAGGLMLTLAGLVLAWRRIRR